MKYVLTIAGSDSCGGAGIQADIRTITGLGAHAMTAITAVTAQNSIGVNAVHEIPLHFISIQIETVIHDIFPDAVKTGMLPNDRAVKRVVQAIKKHNLPKVVVDPVLKASTGMNLMDFSAINTLKKTLLPLCSVVTPNLYEAGILAESKVGNIHEMMEAAKRINEFGPDVVITGGHLEKLCVDLFYDGKEFHRFEGPKIATDNTHGSGCVFSASLAAGLAFGYSVIDAAGLANDYTRRAIAQGYSCGKGAGSVRPFPRMVLAAES